MKIRSIYSVILLLLILPGFVLSQSIVNTSHNLSASGLKLTETGDKTEMCKFCHPGHINSPRQPLWKGSEPGYNYILYNSSTIQASPGQPDGSSLLCLSCHDGTIAPRNIASSSNAIDLKADIALMLKGRSNLGTDLSDDHPISFIYNSSLTAADGELVDPMVLVGPVQLENDRMQCTSCHNPHKNIYTDFLVASTQYSDLCLYCHQKNYWHTSSHRTSNSTWNGSGHNPWLHTTFSTVSENGCENCHNPHGAEGHSRLMNFLTEERNCLNCHNGNVAYKDIQAMLNKPYAHNVYSYTKVHDPAENNIVQTPHVECEDCHNPHASKNFNASAPNANGFIEGVKGVNTNGNSIDPIQYQYELCYRCHADSPNKPGSATSRQIEQNNVRLEFNLNNPSYHPVEGPGKNNNVPSLITPYSESTIIYCTDCHASDRADSPSGPHGSIYPHILKYRYETTNNTAESYQNYRLCYQCHDRNTIINSSGNVGSKIHRKHIVDENTSCNVCHDPHGVSSSQGNSINNTHLINFDISIVSADSQTGRLEFEDLGNFSGSCYLKCHEKNHSNESY